MQYGFVPSAKKEKRTEIAVDKNTVHGSLII